MRSLKQSSQAISFVEQLPVKHRAQIASKVFALLSDPQPHYSKMLKGYPDIYRIASGEYRIVYQWDDSHMYILIINRRNDDEVYRHLARKLT